MIAIKYMFQKNRIISEKFSCRLFLVNLTEQCTSLLYAIIFFWIFVEALLLLKPKIYCFLIHVFILLSIFCSHKCFSTTLKFVNFKISLHTVKLNNKPSVRWSEKSRKKRNSIEIYLLYHVQ